jgi:phage FluMu gp28-like protein
MFMYYHLPEWLKRYGLPTVQTSQGLLKFSNGSMIKAIGQGADQLRQYTATALMIDEMAFMDQAEMTWRAARPVLQGGGRVTMVSSAQASFFERIVHGKLADRDADKDGI